MGKKPVKKFTARQTVALFGVLGALLGGFYLVDRLVLHPWSFSVTGAPTLTGYWEGDVELGPNDTRRFVMQLRYDTPGRRCRGCARIEGDAILCGPSEAEHYEFRGDTENHSGSRFGLDPSRTSGPPGKVLEHLEGEWTEDRITIRTTMHVVDANGTAHASAATDKSTPVVVMDLRRGDKAAFERGC